MNNEIQEIRYQVGEAWKGTYNAGTTYGNANVVQDPTGLSVYRSLKPGNVGHPLTDTAWWFLIIDLSSIKEESDRIKALNDAIAADEAQRVENENGRVTAEQGRVDAENARVTAEQGRVTAEQQRVLAEQQRASQEQTRISQEQSRVTAEQGRVAAEEQRVQKEQLRENNEAQRVINETNRVAAEAERVEQYAADHQQAVADHDQYVDSLGAFDISAYHATGGVLAKYADLTAALGTNGANIPEAIRKGGMSVKFVLSSDNKYVQYRLMSTTWSTTESDWQGVDTKPTKGSHDLVESGGVNEAITRVAPKISYIGLGTGVVYATSNILNNLIPGHEYRIKILNPHALDNISTGTNPKFSIIIDDGNNQQTVVSVRADAGSLQDYYDILMPEGYTNLYLYGRATEGLEFIAYAEDVTSAQKIEAKNKKFVFSENIYKSIKLDKISLYQHGIALKNKFMPKELFESGAVYFNSDGISYSTNSKRIRTKEGCKVFLKAGDIIYVGNGKRVCVSYFDDDDNYHRIMDWRSISYQIVVSGYYCIMLANDPDAEISSIDTFLDTCYFYHNGNFEEVKERVNVLQEVTQFPISGYLDRSGQPVDDARLSITNYIKVEPSKRYRVVTNKLVMGNRLNYATYYSEDGINFTYRDGKYSVYGSLDIKIPQNANYIRIGKINSDDGTYGQLGLYDLTEFTREFGSFMFYDNHHTHGRKLWSNTVITNNNEYTSSSFISNVYYYNVVGLKRIGFTINAVDTYKMYCAFYDVDYNYLSSKDVISSSPAFDIPNNTVYIKIGLSKIENNVAVSTTPDDVSLGMISIDFSQLKTIDGIENLSRYFGNTYQNVEKYLQDVYENFLGFTEKDITLTANKSIKYSNGAYSDKDGYSISDSIFVKNGVTIRYRTYIANENWCSLAVFDKNGVYKKADSARNTLGESIIEFTASYDCYIRISCDTSRLSLLYFSFSGIRASVPNRLKDLEASTYDSGVKDYWLSYLQNKQADINAGIASVGTHGDILIFFSDYHLVANECQSPYLIKYLTERYNIDKVICGGDILNTHNSKEVALGVIEDFNRSFSFTTLYNIFGNHDDNPYGGSANILTVDEYYPLLFKHLENKVHMNRGCYYYFDNDFQKIRYIVLNTHGNGFDLTNAEDIEQLNWFCSTLNSVQEGWYVVVMSHMYYEVYENQDTHLHYVDVSAGGLIYPITDAYQSKTSGSMSKRGVTYNFNFTSANGKIACLLVGHVHSDYSEVRLSETSPYPIISIEQDSTYYTGPVETDPQRTKGTTSEQAFDIVCIDTTNKQIKTIRIGAGEDRTFSFT